MKSKEKATKDKIVMKDSVYMKVSFEMGNDININAETHSNFTEIKNFRELADSLSKKIGSPQIKRLHKKAYAEIEKLSLLKKTLCIDTVYDRIKSQASYAIAVENVIARYKFYLEEVHESAARELEKVSDDKMAANMLRNVVVSNKSSELSDKKVHSIITGVNLDDENFQDKKSLNKLIKYFKNKLKLPVRDTNILVDFLKLRREGKKKDEIEQELGEKYKLGTDRIHSIRYSAKV